MEPNVGTVDAAVRWIIAAVLFLVSLVEVNHVLLSFLIAGLSLGVGASALNRVCLLYRLVGLDTRAGPHRARAPVIHLRDAFRGRPVS